MEDNLAERLEVAIEQLAEGRTADGDDLDEALFWRQ